MPNISDILAAALPGLGKAVFSQPADKAAAQKLSVRPLVIRGETVYQAESIRDNKAMHQNLSADELTALCRDELEGRYRQVLIVSGGESRQYIRRRDGSYKLTGKATASAPAPAAHNREKKYLIAEGECIPALVDLGVFTADYKIVRDKYDKYKQINRFIELINDAVGSSGLEEMTILDFGCGKSYLTFILYYYLVEKLGMRAHIIGYDLKADVVERCNGIAVKYGYSGLEFHVADVTRDTLYDRHIDMVVTLHACDIATDYALNYALRHDVKYIFSVPCCQHEINAQIKKGGELDIFLRHGIIKERMSALLTDSIRAAVLEDMGYEVDMIEFIDFAHSPKNIMLRCTRKRAPYRRGTPRIDEARALAERYGFRQTLLELIKQD